LDRVCTFFFVLMALSASYETEGVGWFVSLVVIAMGLAIVGFIGREVYLARTAASRPKADFFICHNLESSAIVARAAKFTIEYHSGASVLMSIDGQHDLTESLENSRSCKNFIVLWTNSSASCMTTAVEVTSAAFNKRNMAVLELDSIEDGMTDERLQQVESEWTQDSIEQFTAIGLTPAQVTHAYSTLKFVQSVKYNPVGGAKAREESIVTLLESVSSKTLKVPHLSTLPESVDLFIIHDTRSAQANAAAFVLKNAMRSLSFSIVTSADYSDEKFPTGPLGRCQHAMALVHSGVLSSASFTASLLALDGLCKVTTVAVGSDFSAPSNEMLGAMEKEGGLEIDLEAITGMLGSKEGVDSKAIVSKYRTVFRSLALPFSPSAVNNILNAEVGNILGRVKSGKRGTTIGSILLK